MIRASSSTCQRQSLLWILKKQGSLSSTAKTLSVFVDMRNENYTDINRGSSSPVRYSSSRSSCCSRNWRSSNISCPGTFHTNKYYHRGQKYDYNNNNSSSRLFSSAAMEPEYADDNSNNTTAFNLADIGEGIKEVELLQWFVEVGDPVQQFDRICEVQSDKATVEITSRYDGQIAKLEGQVGDMIQVGSPLLYITTKGATATTTTTPPSSTPNMTSVNEHNNDANNTTMLHNFEHSEEQIPVSNDPSSSSPPTPSHVNTTLPPVRSTTAPTTTGNNNNKFLASPAVRKLGKEHNLDLSTIMGTGPNGRVLKYDVMTYLQQQQQPQELQQPRQQQPPQQPSVTTSAAATTTTEDDDQVLTLKGYNRFMVKTMTESLQIPHMVFSDELNAHELLQARQQINQLAAQQLGQNSDDAPVTKVSTLAFMIKAISLALSDYPILNATWHNMDKYEYTLNSNHNIGVAIDTPRGLTVPVIKQVQDLSLLEIQTEMNRLKQDATNNQLSQDDLTGATFSISNVGSIGGGTYMKPLIVPPQVSIGAIGSIQYLPRFTQDAIQDYKQTGVSTTSVENVEIVPIMNVSWSADHRLIDGGSLARFSNTWKQYMESPTYMLMNLK